MKRSLPSVVGAATLACSTLRRPPLVVRRPTVQAVVSSRWLRGISLAQAACSSLWTGSSPVYLGDTITGRVEVMRVGEDKRIRDVAHHGTESETRHLTFWVATTRTLDG